MEVTPVLASGAKPVDGYSAGQFRIAGEVVSGPVLLSPTAVSPAPVTSYDALMAEHLTALLQGPNKPEVLLLGVGAQHNGLPAKALRDVAKAAGVVLEAMNTGAACRTWNVLISEGRRVMALLFPV